MGHAKPGQSMTFFTSPRHDMARHAGLWVVLAWHVVYGQARARPVWPIYFFRIYFLIFHFFLFLLVIFFSIFPYIFPFPPYVYSLFSILFTTFPIFPHFSPPLFLFRFLSFHLKFQFPQAICTVGPIIDPRAVIVVVL